MPIYIASGWSVGAGWTLIGGPPAGSEIITISGLNITTLAGDLLVTI
jgi:hypothetical protein